MICFRLLTYRPMVDIVRSCGTSSKTKLKEWKKPKYSRFSNPGIQRRLGMLEHEGQAVTEPNDIDDTEFDFMEVNKMLDLHESEEENMKQVKQLKIVGNKYFKPEKGPNFLMWSEKEQIHYLHNSDEDTWTVEKLALSFPASEVTIKKILKSKWRPRDANRVLGHDLAVQRNWDLLQSGKLEVDPELKVHLLQFTQRRIPVSHMPDTAGMFGGKDSIPKPKQSEFGSIIESYKSLKCKGTPEEDVKDPDTLQGTNNTSAIPKGDTFLLEGGISYSQHGYITLEKYKERVVKAVKKGCDVSLDAKLMVSRRKKCEHVPQAVEDSNSSITSEVVRNCSTGLDPSVAKKNFDFTNEPPERIRVPPKKWQKGCTFKVGDCYYDDDGTFLYRVPGMK